MTTTIEREESTLRMCCELIGKRGALGILDLCYLTGARDAAVRKAISRGIELGYLADDDKIKRTGRGNRAKTYVRTTKRLPCIAAIDHEPEWIGPEFAPRRHWQDVAFFGPYESRRA